MRVYLGANLSIPSCPNRRQVGRLLASPLYLQLPLLVLYGERPDPGSRTGIEPAQGRDTTFPVTTTYDSVPEEGFEPPLNRA